MSQKGSSAGSAWTFLFFLVIAGIVVFRFEPFRDRYPEFYREVHSFGSGAGEWAGKALAGLGERWSTRGSGPADSKDARARLKDEERPKQVDRLTDKDRKGLNDLINKFE